MAPSPRNKTIGIFDSGFGGLTIMRGIVKELPDYDFVYLGDTARVPYGTRSEETIRLFTKQAIDFLFSKNCDLIIIACNTASSEALAHIQQQYLPVKHPGKKVLGVIIPTAEYAALKTKNGNIGVIATERTTSSNAFRNELWKINPALKVNQNACPLLVPFIEAGEHNSQALKLVLKKYLAPLLKKKIDTLILGCTHYEIIAKTIQNSVDKDITIVSESSVVAKSLKEYLKRHPEIEKTLSKKRRRTFYSTDLTDTFERRGSKFFGEPITVKKADIA